MHLTSEALLIAKNERKIMKKYEKLKSSQQLASHTIAATPLMSSVC